MDTKNPVILKDWMSSPQCGTNSKLTSDSADGVYHSHDFYEIFYILDGEITHIFNGETEILTMGDIRFLSPGDAHGFVRSAEQLSCKHRDIVISPVQFAECKRYLGKIFMEELVSNSPSPRARLTIEQIKHFETRLVALNHLVSPLESEKRRTLAQLILAELFGVFFEARNPLRQQYPQWLQDLLQRFTILEFMKEGLEKILEDTYLSRSHCCRTFKKLFGITMEKYLCQNRLNVAANLLQFTDNTVLNICNSVGFSSLAYFNKQFKMQFGCTPHEFRNTMRTKIINI